MIDVFFIFTVAVSGAYTDSRIDAGLCVCEPLDQVQTCNLVTFDDTDFIILSKQSQSVNGFVRMICYKEGINE